MAEMPSINLSGVKIRPSMHIDQYFGVWAVEPQRFSQMLNHVSNINLASHVDLAGNLQGQMEMLSINGSSFDDGLSMEITPSGTAIINLQGTLTKHGSSFSTQGSTSQARAMVRRASRSDKVRNILLRIDTPGGSVAGTDDLARDVAAASKKKNIVAYAEDLMASAAYWVGSQANSIYANPSAEIGSIGVYTYMHDMSGMAEKDGVRAIVVRSGKFKGMGTPGEAISDEMVSEVQRTVDAYAQDFIEAVASGRDMSSEDVSKLADGRTFKAKQAKKNGLIDGIMSLDELINMLDASSEKEDFSAVNNRPAEQAQDKETNAMSDTNETGGSAKETQAESPKATAIPATLQELRGACIGASSDFLVSQIEANATVQQAMSAWIAKQNEQIEASAKTEAAKAKVTTGVEIDASATSKPDANDFESSVNAEMKSSGCSRHEAYRRVARRNPESRIAMVQSYNSERGRPCNL